MTGYILAGSRKEAERFVIYDMFSSSQATAILKRGLKLAMPPYKGLKLFKVLVSAEEVTK